MNIVEIIERSNWNIEKAKFFLTTKLFNEELELRKDLDYPESFIIKIENTPQFSLFEELTYNQMKDYQNECDMSFTQNTLDTVSLIEQIPHTMNLCSSDFTQEDCLIMVDASLKKYADQEHAGIAGCIRNSSGNIVAGFRKTLQREILVDNDTSFNTNILELNAILEGLDIANTLKLKNYTITSDCIGNVISIHKAQNGIPPLSSDYFLNKDIYNKILEQLERDNAKVVYIPRNYNNIADDFSKSYQKKLGDLFRLNNHDIRLESINVLEHKNDFCLSKTLFFHQNNQFNHNKDHNPYEMIKNIHLEHVINFKKQPHYENYLVSIINFSKGPMYNHIFHFSVDPLDHKFELISIDSDYISNQHTLSLLFSMSKTIDSLKNKNIGILCSIGMNATLNRIVPILKKDLAGYQELYRVLNHMEHWGAFLRPELTVKKIQNWIIDYVKSNSENTLKNSL